LILQIHYLSKSILIPLSFVNGKNKNLQLGEKSNDLHQLVVFLQISKIV